VSHSARDYISIDEQFSFFEKALIIEEEMRIPVAHETHRGRALWRVN
jgi:hypothetical protein